MIIIVTVFKAIYNKNKNELYTINNKSIKRMGKGVPWDINHNNYKNYKWAPDYDVDTDEIYFGKYK